MDMTRKETKPGKKQLRIALVGGHERTVRHLIERGKTVGWTIEQHSGEMKGRGPKSLESQIARADIVVITTKVNSHGGMFRAKHYARRFGRFTTIIRHENFSEIENAIIQFKNSSCRNYERRRI